MNKINHCKNCQKKIDTSFLSMIDYLEKAHEFLEEVVNKFKWECEKCGTVKLKIIVQTQSKDTKSKINYTIKVE